MLSYRNGKTLKSLPLRFSFVWKCQFICSVNKVQHIWCLHHQKCIQECNYFPQPWCHHIRGFGQVVPIIVGILKDQEGIYCLAVSFSDVSLVILKLIRLIYHLLCPWLWLPPNRPIDFVRNLHLSCDLFKNLLTSDIPRLIQ